MGAIQEPTRAMGPYATEIRRESFYLTCIAGATGAAGPNRINEQTLRIPASHAAFLLAALDQVRAHLGWQSWQMTGQAERQGITVTRDGDYLLLGIPCPEVYDQQLSNGTVAVTAEIEYRDVSDLSHKLVTEEL